MNNIESSKVSRQIIELAKFAWQYHKVPISLTGVVLLIIIYDFLTGWTALDTLKERWNNDLDQMVSLATLMVALFVWWGEIVQEWRNRLPKRLTINFQYVDENNNIITVMECIKAHLSGISDIRALGQQIGMQMNKKQQLDFRAPFVIQDEGIIQSDEEMGYYLHYHVTFTLTKLPENLSSGTCRVWQSPFDEANLIDKDISE